MASRNPVRKNRISNDRTRQTLAQEAARIIVEQGIEDYRVAKTKAAERLGLSTRGSLPGNSEIEAAVGEHLLLFGRESHRNLLQVLRQTAVTAMRILSPFDPRLVGPVLHGTASASSAVNMHVFSDAPELIAIHLEQQQMPYKSFERRLKIRRDRADTYAGYRFVVDDHTVEATVFPIDGMRQAPFSPVDGKPMKRADQMAVERMLESGSP